MTFGRAGGGGRIGALAVGVLLLGVLGSIPAMGPLPAAATARHAPTAAAGPSPGAAQTLYYVVGQPVGGRPDYLFAIAAKTLGDGRRSSEIFELNRDRLQHDGGRLQDPLTLVPGWILILPADAQGPDVRVGEPTPAEPRTGAGEATGSSGGTPGGLLRAGVLGMVFGLLGWASWRLYRGSVLLRRRRMSASAPQPPPMGEHRGEPASAVPTTGTDERIPARLSVVRDEPGTPPVPHGPAAPQVLQAQLVSGTDAVRVRLVGVRPDPRATPPAWVYATAPPGAALIALGENSQGVLYADLTRAPDVITITGPAEGRRRQALALARRLGDAGLAVTVIGDCLATVPAGCRQAACPADAEPRSGGPHFVFQDAEEGFTPLQGHAAGSDLLVPVLIGAARRARWSIDVQSLSGGSQAR